MDLRSYYLSRFLFLIIWSIVTDMKCQSLTRIKAAVCAGILFTHGLKLEELLLLTGCAKKQTKLCNMQKFCSVAYLASHIHLSLCTHLVFNIATS